jgi:hypothetical protein
VSLAGEYVHVDEDEGTVDKQTGLGVFPLASEFRARGFWTQAAYALPTGWTGLRVVTVYGRYEERRAWFTGFRPIEVARVTGGVRLDLWESLIFKAEALFNREKEGAPKVHNDVLAASAVYSW